jgi:hypothetical protein
MVCRGMSRFGFRVLTRYVDIVRKEKPAGTQFRHDLRKTGAGHSEAAFAATGHTEMADDFFADVPGAVHHNPSGEGVVIAVIQSLEPNRMAMGSDIGGIGSIGSCGARVRAWCVGEARQPAGMQRVGSPSMRDQMRAHAAIGEIHQVKSREARGQREIGNADEILESDAVAVSFQRVQGTTEQDRRYGAIDAVSSRRSRARHGRRTSQTGQGETEEMTARCQDVEFLLQ